MTTPRISVQIVTWNSAHVIDSCLESVLAQTYPHVETIVVDNASRDDSANLVSAWVDKRGLAGRVLRQDHNSGFCGGHNRAFAESTGEWILFLNPDTVLPPDFLADAARVIERMTADVGTIAPCIMRPDGRVDSTGLELDRYRRAFDRGRGEPSAVLYQKEEDVFGCTGAVALHRRAMLMDVAPDGKPLDELLFAYYDDIDLSWRARMLGWRCRYVPALVAVHSRAARNAIRSLAGRPTRAPEQALMVRNRFLVMAKCDRVIDLVRDLPFLLLYEAARLPYLAVRAPGALGGYLDACKSLGEALGARRTLQRRVSSVT